MASAPKSNINLVCGAMTFGEEGQKQARVHTLEDCSAILDIFQRHGHSEIDTARFYGGGTSEKVLGELQWQKRGLVMDTKYYPTAGRNLPNMPEWRHTEEHIRKNLMDSLKALKADKVDLWYLHAPDRSTPYEETLAAVNKLHEEGFFDRFGISNYMAWEVAQICEICIKNNYVRPSVYQGIYNAIHRTVEQELFPCLKYYGIAFYGFKPLAGGNLTDQYHRHVEPGSRVDPGKSQGKMYQMRYRDDVHFDALDILRAAAKKYKLTEAECALRWMTHHSQLKREKGDAIVIGASSTKHMEQNMIDLEKGPLPEDVVEALDQAWERVRGVSWRYWH